MKTSYIELVVGVSDKDSLDDLNVNKVKTDLEEAFKQLAISFSLTTQKGGYVTENGQYVIEDSIKLVFIGNYTDEQINRFASKVKEIYNQESILYVRKEIEQEYVRD